MRIALDILFVNKALRTEIFLEFKQYIRFHYMSPKMTKCQQIRIAPIMILQSKYRSQLFKNRFFMNSYKYRCVDNNTSKPANTR
jgi:hypothetical protein